MSTPCSEPVTLQEAIANHQHGQALQMLQKLPLKNRWNTYFLLHRSFDSGKSKDYVRSLSHALLYRAYREECLGNLSEALQLYRLLLQHNAGLKLTRKAREGVKRISSGQSHQLEQLPSAPPKAPQKSGMKKVPDDEMSLVLLTPVAMEKKKQQAVALAQILQTDPYTARLKFPSAEFRILRQGMGRELQPFYQALTQAAIACRHVSIDQIKRVPVYDILYIESTSPELVLQVRDTHDSNSSKTMTVQWLDVRQRVNGLLPLFEDVVERNKQGKLIRKTLTQDHAQIVDLHLKPQGILRFYDSGYQFNQGISLVQPPQTQHRMEAKTSWAQWQGLKKVLDTHLPPMPEQCKFDHFATHVLEQIEILAQIKPHINLMRRYESYWDQAFHLYSSLHYLAS